MSTLAHTPNTTTGARSFGAVIYDFLSLESTNVFAAKLLTKFRPKHGTIVAASYQSAGRGQFGRQWHSAPGLNLCLSYLLFPDLRATEQFHLSMATALALYDLVTTVIPDSPVTIKWPNDLYVGDSKIAGILIQNTLQGASLTASIAGIGLNVNETEFPPDLPNPTSLLLEWRHHTCAFDLSLQRMSYENGPVFRLSVLRDLLSQCLHKRLEQLISATNDLVSTYQRLLYRRDEPAAFLLPGEVQPRTGHLSHVDDSGRLVIRWEGETEGRYQFREIAYVI